MGWRDDGKSDFGSVSGTRVWKDLNDCREEPLYIAEWDGITLNVRYRVVGDHSKKEAGRVHLHIVLQRQDKALRSSIMNIMTCTRCNFLFKWSDLVLLRSLFSIINKMLLLSLLIKMLQGAITDHLNSSYEKHPPNLVVKCIMKCRAFPATLPIYTLNYRLYISIYMLLMCKYVRTLCLWSPHTPFKCHMHTFTTDRFYVQIYRPTYFLEITLDKHTQIS